MRIQKIINEYFTFSKKQRNACLALIIIIIISFIAPTITKLFYHNHVNEDYLALKYMLDTMGDEGTNQYAESNLQQGNNTYKNTFYKNDYTQENTYNKPDINLFYFDPNTSTKSEFIQLGIKDYIADRIIKYISKGGHFKSKEDLRKIYGITEQEYERVKDYIQIDTAAFTKKFDSKNDSVLAVSIPEELIDTEKIYIDINSATVNQLIQDGVDKMTASKIINFRNSVGGFYSLDQLNDVYEINVESINKLLPYLTIDSKKIKIIHLNTATLEELTAHGYISNKLASDIVNYRTNYGNFTSVSEAQKIIYQKLYQKLKPYLAL